MEPCPGGAVSALPRWPLWPRPARSGKVEPSLPPPEPAPLTGPPGGCQPPSGTSGSSRVLVAGPVPASRGSVLTLSPGNFQTYGLEGVKHPAVLRVESLKGVGWPSLVSGLFASMAFTAASEGLKSDSVARMVCAGRSVSELGGRGWAELSRGAQPRADFERMCLVIISAPNLEGDVGASARLHAFLLCSEFGAPPHPAWSGLCFLCLPLPLLLLFSHRRASSHRVIARPDFLSVASLPLLPAHLRPLCLCLGCRVGPRPCSSGHTPCPWP